MTNTIIIGIGNPLMGDDGIGSSLVNELAAEYAGRAGLEFADVGVSGMRVLHLLAGRKKAVIIDGARMRAEPGEIRRFTPDEVTARNLLAHLDTHEGNLLEIIDLARRLGELPEEVVIFGIEPADLAPGERLSLTLADRLESYRQIISKEFS